MSISIAWTTVSLCAYIITIAMNVVVGVYGHVFGVDDTKQVSDSLQSDLNPISYTFSIWLLLYGWQVPWLIGGYLPSPYGDIYNTQGLWFVLVCVCNSAWIIAFGRRQIDASVSILTACWIFLFKLYVVTNIQYLYDDAFKIWMINVPFSLYFGWITVAWVLNVFGTGLVPRQNQGKLFFFLSPTLLLPITYVTVYHFDFVYAIPILVGLTGMLFKEHASEWTSFTALFLISGIILWWSIIGTYTAIVG